MISKEQNSKWKKSDAHAIPGPQIPSWRVAYANQEGVQDNILIKTWGGIGDQVCAEPIARFALEHFKDCKITLASEIPEIFQHLKFNDVFDLKKERPIEDDYLVFNTNSEASVYNLMYNFMCHNVIQCVDFASLAALRCHLPIKNKNVVFAPPSPPNEREDLWSIKSNRRHFVAVHAGKHWQSKTFPKWWWDRVIDSIIEQGLTPVLIGKEIDEGQGTVDTKTNGCIDLRNKTSLNESIWLLNQVPVVICNDSSPLHMAAYGNAFIGFLATAKHQDFISHWRRSFEGVNEWSWRMKHFNLGGMWDLMSFCPNAQEEKTLDKVDQRTLLSWLPEPEILGRWAKEKRDEYFR